MTLTLKLKALGDTLYPVNPNCGRAWFGPPYDRNRYDRHVGTFPPPTRRMTVCGGLGTVSSNP